MALRKAGKYWHVIYRDIHNKIREVSLHETDKRKALVLERNFMSELSAAKKRQRQMRLFGVVEPPASPKPSPLLDATQQRPRIKLADALDVYRKYYGEPSRGVLQYWKKFSSLVTYSYMDEITPYIAFAYLDEVYGDVSGRSFNEAKSSLNLMYKKLLIQAGVDASPFAGVANRKRADRSHWRSVSMEEIHRLLEHATLAQRAAITITYCTGLRRSSVYALKWGDIRNDEAHNGFYFRHLPPKTARFDRYVEIPIGDKLLAYLQKLPRVDEYIMGFDKQARKGGANECRWTALFEKAEVRSDERGIASYGSIRKMFIERCDAANMRRSATRGIVGQTSDDITDVYSSDYIGALPIKDFEFPR